MKRHAWDFLWHMLGWSYRRQFDYSIHPALIVRWQHPWFGGVTRRIPMESEE